MIDLDHQFQDSILPILLDADGSRDLSESGQELLRLLAQHLGIAPSRLLMPVSFAAILGGTMTLIGTSTNVLVASLAHTQLETMKPLGFFEFTPVGAGYADLIGHQ